MQRDKTIQFWDDYHGENDSEEWISKPGEVLLGMIFDQIYDRNADEEDQKMLCQKRCISVLEIGCGTSTLVRDLKKYIEERHPMIKVVACGTDVSKVCIDANQQRDCPRAHPGSVTADDKYTSNNIDNNGNSRGLLWYEVLNVLDGEPSRQNWNLIIDKGCLDTFLFRSRQRGTHNKNYPESLRILLDNLHGWQGITATAGSATIGDDVPGETTSVYICITPRPKLKAVRDYAGFSSVKRYPLPKIYRSKLEGKKNNDSKVESEGYDDNGDNDSGESSYTCTATAFSGYMYVCTKNDDYKVGVSVPFPTVIIRHNNNNNSPNDENECLRCKRTFREFRKEEGLEFRGVSYCTRKWKTHCIHCKSDPVRTN